ncbi:MAG TPA: hypothetical protein PLI88_07055 [Bacillota bacterium]|nr:hypothetical protein [Bacillota bacterium]HOH09803.1 hypothetical protein [Bacillota bacterium]HOY88665.1 hypothetical protein [Bacillota bacterium]HPI01882.1 hypothetical protein [Bacillota bacterium]HPM63801.1 hypothetical protein [Bacillota bacterium]
MAQAWNELLAKYWRQSTFPTSWKDWTNPAVNTEIVECLGI